MRYLHTMIRIKNLDKSLYFYKNILGLKEIRRKESEKGRFTLIFLKTEQSDAEIELTYNWDRKDDYTCGNSFGHLAFEVENIYETCDNFLKNNIEILRPPRDGRMAFIKSPDGISIELLQKGSALSIQSPWKEMNNIGEW